MSQAKMIGPPTLDDYVSETVLNASGSAQGVAATASVKFLREFMTEPEMKAMGVEKGISFLGAGSAKVLHSSQAEFAGNVKYLNVVQYLAPADRAAMSFMVRFPQYRDTVMSGLGIPKLQQALAKAGPEWKDFVRTKGVRAVNETKRLAAIHKGVPSEEVKKMLADPSKQTIIPDYKGQFLSLCPYASPDCRAVCLNTSGQGGTARTDLIKGFEREARSQGFTETDSLHEIYLRTGIGLYGGESNHTTAARVRRTHVMLLSWIRQGILDNSYNKMLAQEAEFFLDRTDVLRKKLGGVWPMALRLNGTSDFPVHTLRVGGKNLVASLHSKGIVCYDYTKDIGKMSAWMKANNWNPKAKTTTVKGGFPNNYHLVFSWSEINLTDSVKVLQGGGNVVMVFRRSSQAEKKGDVFPLGTKPGSIGIIPTHLKMGSIPGHDVEVGIINGDAHDLRFVDPYHVGHKNKGSVVGLIAKGLAQKWELKDKVNYLKNFLINITLERSGKKILAVPRTNPSRSTREGGAVDVVDIDLLRMNTVKVDGFEVAPTGMGT